MGSYGLVYFKCYFREYEKFILVCVSNDFSVCLWDSIINGYDNILLYIDYVLVSLIDLLCKNEECIDIGMFYFFDYGELFGEYNFYLYGMFYLLVLD